MEAVETKRGPWRLPSRRRSTTARGTPWGHGAPCCETGRVSMRVAPFPLSGSGFEETKMKRFCFVERIREVLKKKRGVEIRCSIKRARRHVTTVDLCQDLINGSRFSMPSCKLYPTTLHKRYKEGEFLTKEKSEVKNILNRKIN